MPNNGTAKIKWARKRVYILAGVICLALLFLVIFRLANRTQKIIEVKGYSYHITEAKTADQQARGLSGTTHLSDDDAMLFIYDSAGKKCFWMKDMNYAIDIIWIAADKKVTAIEREVPPQSYPEEICHDGQYILEVASGQAQKRQLKIGDLIKF